MNGERVLDVVNFSTLKNYSEELKLLSDKNLLEDQLRKIFNLEVWVFSGLMVSLISPAHG